MTKTAQLDLLKKEHLDILKELLLMYEAMEECQPHFANRRRIGELKEKIAKFK
jgi:hypothetical protein